MVEKIKLESLSKNIVQIMNELSKNEGLARLLINYDKKPFDKPVEVDKTCLVNPNHELCRIYPYPFDVNATIEDGAFLRVYYNNGSFDETEVIVDSQIHIDIVVSKSLWLINNGVDSMIRPYEILSRVTDMIGRRNANRNVRLELDGWQHLAVNTKFDAIRLYCKFFTVET